VLWVAGEFGIYAVLDVLLGDGGFALLPCEIDGFSEIAEDVRAPWVFGRRGGLDGGFGGGTRRRFGAGAPWEKAGGKADFQGYGCADFAGEAEEDELRVRAPWAGRFGGWWFGGGLGFLNGLADSELGELRAEHDKTLEHVHVACGDLGGLWEAGRGGDDVQVFGSAGF